MKITLILIVLNIKAHKLLMISVVLRGKNHDKTELDPSYSVALFDSPAITANNQNWQSKSSVYLWSLFTPVCWGSLSLPNQV